MRIDGFTTLTNIENVLTFKIEFDSCSVNEFETFDRVFRNELRYKKIRLLSTRIDADKTVDAIHEVYYTTQRKHKNATLIHDRMAEIAFSLEDILF